MEKGTRSYPAQERLFHGWMSCIAQAGPATLKSKTYIFMVLGGMMALALPLLVVVGIVAIIVSIFK